MCTNSGCGMLCTGDTCTGSCTECASNICSQLPNSTWVCGLDDSLTVAATTTGGICSTDLDCPSRFVCFNPDITPWLRNETNMNGNNRNGTCDCSRTLGRGGSRCDQLHSSQYLDLGILICLGIIVAALFLVMLIDLLRLLWLVGFRATGFAVTHAVFFMLAGVVSHFIWKFLQAGCDDESKDYIVFQLRFKQCTRIWEIIIFAMLTVVFTFVCLVNLWSIWYAYIYPDVNHDLLDSWVRHGTYKALFPVIVCLVLVVIFPNMAFWLLCPIFVVILFICILVNYRARVRLWNVVKAEFNSGRLETSLGFHSTLHPQFASAPHQWRDDDEQYSDEGAGKSKTDMDSSSGLTVKFKQEQKKRDELIKQLDRVIFYSNWIIFWVIIAVILAVCCFVVLLQSYSFSYEPDFWNRPAHWLLRGAEASFVLAIIGFVIYVHLILVDAINLARVISKGFEWKA